MALTHNNKVLDDEPKWSDVDKTKLPRNAFADTGEADSKSTWKYPHHWVKDGGDLNDDGIYTSGDMYLHRGGLNAAWAAANGARSGKKASDDVITHLQKHREALGLNAQRLYAINTLATSSVVPRREVWEDKEYFVVPVVALVEGVHHGSGGPGLYLAEEFGRFVSTWNGCPVPVFHPEQDGILVSARDQDIIAKQTVGQFWNAHIDDGKLKGEIWFDKDKITRIAPEVLDIINSGGQLEVSTGLFSDDEWTAGEWNGETYDAIVRNIRPDHLAVLPGGQGACSWEDGCGVRANSKDKGGDSCMGDNVEELVKELACEEVQKDKGKLMGLVKRIGKVLGFNAQELSHDDVRGKLQSIVDGFDQPPAPAPGQYHYVKDVFDDYFVYEKRVDGNESPKLYRQAFKVDEQSGDVVLDGEPEEVVEKREYVKAASENGKPPQWVTSVRYLTLAEAGAEDNPKNNKEDNMDEKCKELIDALVNNEATHFAEEDREWLKDLSTEQLEKLVPKEKEEPDKKEDTQEPEVNADGKADGDDPSVDDKPKTADEYIADAPDEIKEMLSSGLQMHRDKKAKLVKGILDNERNKFTKEQLESKTLDELQAIADLARVEADYSLQSGTPPEPRPKANERQPDGTGVPEMPRMNWAANDK